MAPTAVFVSFRLGGTDGVSVEAAKWESALATLGFRTRRLAGEILDGGRRDDAIVPELALPRGPDGNVDPPPVAVEAALEGADLVVVENLLSLPLNLPAARVVAKVIATHGRVILRHHDLPWQRAEYEHVDELPPRLEHALHVTINELSSRELGDRGITAHLVRNHFDLDPPPGNRDQTREALGLDDGDLLVLHPVRAIARKNVPGALALCAALDTRLPGHRIHYWLPGPAEDGYGPLLDDLLRGTRVGVIRAAAQPVGDAYAACDLVAFPSTWEGFGNPVIESVAHRRPLAAGDYPVMDELRGLGFEFLSASDPETLAAVLIGMRDESATLEKNLDVARRHLALELLPGRLQELFDLAGWTWP
ncbi:MAG: glycosyltransferase [Actinobacteria bacterium]|nr:glycosyltransferase [Actinomycetota bacterium]